MHHHTMIFASTRNCKKEILAHSRYTKSYILVPQLWRITHSRLNSHRIKFMAFWLYTLSARVEGTKILYKGEHIPLLNGLHVAASGFEVRGLSILIILPVGGTLLIFL